ncbi:hypothetical protein [Haloplanus halophilus]|uniref:hypothetical protein n=1 Tax=Haloplanus halophilus TaxID=2949993 RepID=UPI00203D8269|nr:hypothetical protein [Haloplanus sp. GDY1]
MATDHPTIDDRPRPTTVASGPVDAIRPPLVWLLRAALVAHVRAAADGYGHVAATVPHGVPAFSTPVSLSQEGYDVK